MAGRRSTWRDRRDEQELVRLFRNEFAARDATLGPLQARTFPLRAWSVARRVHNDGREDGKAPTLAAFDDEEDEEDDGPNYFMSGQSSIMARRIAPSMRKCRNPLPRLVHAASTDSGDGPAEPRSPEPVRRTSPSSTPLLQALRDHAAAEARRPLRSSIPFADPRAPGADVPSIHHGSAAGLSVAPRRITKPSQRGALWARTAEPTEMTPESDIPEGVIGMLHPARPLNSLNYEELYREQQSVTADLLEKDTAYMELVDSLDAQMAAVKFTFKSMLDGQFLVDEEARAGHVARSRSSPVRAEKAPLPGISVGDIAPQGNAVRHSQVGFVDAPRQ